MENHTFEPVKYPKQLLDLAGRSFGRLTVLELAGRRSDNNRVYWRCACACGTITFVASHALARGRSKSCGCRKKESHQVFKSRHGAHKTKLYKVWRNIRARCQNPEHKYYHRYGGRGIKVCDRWQDFSNFLADMGERPENGTRLTVERIDNDKGYEPGNCRYATYNDQARNRCSTVLLDIDGRTQPLMQWAEEKGVDAELIRNRINTLGWPITSALFKPARRIKRKTST